MAVNATHERQAISLFQRDIVKRALLDSLVKLDPRVQLRNPVMFVVEIGALITTVSCLIQLFGGKPLGGGGEPGWYTVTIAIWLWLTVIFANMAEAFAEGRGRAQADTLRNMRKETVATMRDGSMKAASALSRGDIVVVVAGELIPGDGSVIEGIATVDESAITGESAPVIRESGGDRSAVTGGTRVTSDRIVVEITQEPGKSFLDRMIALVEGAERRKTPNEIALNILLAALTLIFMIVVATLRPFGLFAGTSISETTLDRAARGVDPNHHRRAAIGDRDRGHGQACAPQRARALRPGGGGKRGRGRAACSTRPARSRSATVRPPSSSRCPASPSQSSPRPRNSPRSPTRRPRVARSWCLPSSTGSASQRSVPPPGDRRRARGSLCDSRRVRALHRANAHERCRLRRPAAAQGRRRRHHRVRGGRGRPSSAGVARAPRPHRPRGRHAACGRPRQPDPRRGVPQGHHQGRHEGALRAAPRDGHQDGDGDRRQPPHCRQDRAGVGRGRLPGRSHPRGASWR